VNSPPVKIFRSLQAEISLTSRTAKGKRIGVTVVVGDPYCYVMFTKSGEK
jgi:hypothetical protein